MVILVINFHKTKKHHILLLKEHVQQSINSFFNTKLGKPSTTTKKVKLGKSSKQGVGKPMGIPNILTGKACIIRVRLKNIIVKNYVGLGSAVILTPKDDI